jgi:hypothetical protein
LCERWGGRLCIDEVIEVRDVGLLRELLPSGAFDPLLLAAAGEDFVVERDGLLN